MAGADVVVVGAGAAGIAAARLLRDRGLDVLLVEAGDRLGGRARSLSLVGLPVQRRSGQAAAVDLGCGWLHSAKRNPWTELAQHYGFDVDRSPSNWGEQWRNLGFTPDEQQAFSAAWDHWDGVAHDALDGPDRPLSDFLDPCDPWRPMIDAISGYANGARLEDVSLQDWAAYEDAASDDNWGVHEGYGTLVAHHATGVPVTLGTEVKRIDHRAALLKVETNCGTIETRHVIVCVPTTVLADERIVFDPPLPDKHIAAAALPLGVADKIFLRVDGIALPRNAHLIGNPHSACTASYRLAPFALPVIECFLGGACAERIEREDDAGATAFVIDEMVGLLGGDWRARLTPIARTRWKHAPHIYGSYSHAKVAERGQRAVLAEAIDDRLFFAGEACSSHDFSTAHGAYQTGIDAAQAVLAARSCLTPAMP